MFTKVPANSPPLLAIYCWTGDVTGDYWFAEHRGGASIKYSDINHPIDNIEEYYDNMAGDYEDVVRSWGYNMPESVIDALVKHGNLQVNKQSSFLDLGCGDGLCGFVLKVKFNYYVHISQGI